jgi:hypothetical protein
MAALLALLTEFFNVAQVVIPVAESSVGEVQAIIDQISGHPDLPAAVAATPPTVAASPAAAAAQAAGKAG